MPLRVSLLGPVEVLRDGAPVEVDTRKAIALLAYLAVTGRPHPREALAALLWPDADRERAGGALRRTLSTLRAAVGRERLAVDRATVALVPAAAEIDVFRATQLARTGERASLAEAAALHRGPFLEGFALRDSPAFDDWQFFMAEELRRDLAGILERLSRLSEAAGDLDAAIGAARRRLALDPLHEPSHRDLMRLYADHGRHAAALHQYRECVRVLDRELGVPPLEETTALYREIVTRRLMPAQVAPAAAPPTSVRRALPTAHPFADREEERHVLFAAVEAITADGALVVVEGEAGIGKSRLVAEVLGDARLAGRACVVARCYEGENGLAYGLVAESIRAALDRRDRAWLGGVADHILIEVGRLVPELSALRPGIPPPASLDGPAAGSRLVDAVGRFLGASVSGPRPGLLVVEDLHWADDASLDVLTHVVRRLRGRPLAILGTWRTERVGRGSRLRRMVAEARRDGVATVLSLGRLDAPAVATIVEAAAPGAAAQAARVYEETEGLPLLVTEYAAALAADGHALDGPLPVGARDVLLARLDGLGHAASQVLATAAVIGRAFDPETLREGSGRSDEETTAALEELLGHGLVAESGGGAYDFTHHQLRALAYAEAGLARRRLLHRRVGQALAARALRTRQEGTLASAIASHLRLAGLDEEAGQWSARAGDHAAALLAFSEAAGHYEQALALGHPDPARLHEALGDLHTRNGRYGDALASYEAAAAISGGERTAALEHKLGDVHARRGDWLLADRHYEDALGALGGDGPRALAARLLADRSLAAHRRGAAEEAEELAHAAMEAARVAGDAAALAQAHNLLGMLAKGRGELASARRELTRSLELARNLDDPRGQIAAANNLALVESEAGDLDQALALAETALVRSAVVGDRYREAAVRSNLADLARLAGRQDESTEHREQAVALFAEVGEAGVPVPEIWRLVDW